MIQVSKKQIKIFSVAIAAVFLGSVVALALTQMGNVSGIASAASTSVGVVDYGLIMNQNTAVQDARTQLQVADQDAQREFESKSAGMSDEDKAKLARELQEGLAKKERDLIEPIQKKINAEVKSVAEAKGLQVVIHKGAVAYGGQDITQDVIRKLTK